MAGSKGFRVILDLSKYFSDHRRFARIYVRANFKTIQDLQVHISNIFKIRDYYLTSGDHYLPVLEDIGVLISDETICVVPNQENVASNVSSLVSSSLCSNNTKQEPRQEQNVSCGTIHKKRKADTVRLSRRADTPLNSYKKYRPPPMITGEYLKKTSNNIIKIDVLEKDNIVEPSNVSKNKEYQDSSKNYAVDSLEIPNPQDNVSTTGLPEGKVQNSFEKSDVPINDISMKNDTTKIDNPKSFKNEMALDVSSNMSPKLNSDALLNLNIENNKLYPSTESSPFVDMRKRMRILEENNYIYSNNDKPINATSNDKIQDSLEKKYFSNSYIPEIEDPSKLCFPKSSTNKNGLEVSPIISPTLKNNSSAVLNSGTDNKKIFPFSLTSPFVNMGKQTLEENSCYSPNNEISINAVAEGKIQKSLEKNDLSNNDICKKEDTSKINFLNSSKNEIAFDGFSDIAPTLNNSNATLNLGTENDNNFTSDASLPVDIKRKRIRIRRRKKPKEPASRIKETGPFIPLFRVNPCSKVKSTSECPASSVHIRFKADKIDSKKANKKYPHADSKFPDDEEMWAHQISKGILLKTMPKIGDVIAFKMLKMGENYTPEITNHIIGEVETCQSETKEVRMKILGGMLELTPPSSGKFGLIDREDGEESTTRSFIFTELIVPKLLDF